MGYDYLQKDSPQKVKIDERVNLRVLDKNGLRKWVTLVPGMLVELKIVDSLED